MPYLGAVPATVSAVDVVDGSLTNADIHSTAAIASSKIDHGTTANKIIALNSSAQIPAVDGALLQNVGRVDEVTVTPTLGQTNFSITYTIGKILVFLNGVKLIKTTDFTATNGNDVTLIGANNLTVNDRVDFVTF